MANQKNLDFLQGKPPAAEPPTKYREDAVDDYISDKPSAHNLRPEKVDPTATEHAD